MKLQTQGFSLIEVIIFIGILSVFFVTGMVVVTFSLQNMRINQHRTVGVQYANQLNAWIRAQKETDWNSFVSQSDHQYCFNTVPIPSSWPSQQPCSPADFSLGGLFNRNATLTSSGSPTDKIQSDIVVTWYENGRLFNVSLRTYFSRWE